jgi:hypothetical protein
MKSDIMEATDNHSLDCCSTSNYDNAFVNFKSTCPLITFEAPPPPPACKKAAEKVEHHNRSAKIGKKATASSNNNGKAMVYAQPFAASAKGFNEPLAFSSESN